MTAVVVPAVLIAIVLTLMLAVACTTAAVHGWEDATNPDTTRHGGLPGLAYRAGTRLRQARLDIARAELEQRHTDTEAFYAALDTAVKAELARKTHR